MKKLKLFFFSLITILFFGANNVNALISGDFSYDVNSDENTITITGYSATGSKNVVIPDAIDDKYVTIIGAESFENLSLTSVILPKHLNEIGESAFSTNELSNIIIPDGVTIIGNNSFEINKLTSVSIPKGVVIIGESAFETNLLTSVTIPKSVTTIGFCAFAGQINDLDEPLITEAFILNKNTEIGDEDYDVFKESLTSDFKLYGYKESTAKAFADEIDCDFVVLKEITATMINEIPIQYFDGSELTPTIVINDEGNILNKGTDYTVLYENNNSVGTGKAIITGIGDYFGSDLEKMFIIENQIVEPKEITLEMIKDIPTQYFTGSLFTPAIVIKDGETVLIEGIDYNVSYKNNDETGIGIAKITGIGNYSGSIVNKSFKIEKMQYLISIDYMVGAVVTPNTTIKIDYDNSQNYTIKAEEGYKIISILVNETEKLSTLENNMLTIKSPTSDTIIVVKTEKTEKSTDDKNTEISVDKNPKTGDKIIFFILIEMISIIVLLSIVLNVKNKLEKN